MRVRCYRSFEELQPLQGQINSLNLASARPDPFATFEFYEHYWQHYDFSVDGANPELIFLTAFDGDRLVGYVALKCVTQKIFGLKARKLEFLVLHDSDRPHLVAVPQLEPQVSDAFFGYLAGCRPRWSLFELQQQDDASSVFPPSSMIDRDRYSVRRWSNVDTHTIPAHWPTVQAYFGALARKFRNNLRR